MNGAHLTTEATIPSEKTEVGKPSFSVAVLTVVSAIREGQRVYESVGIYPKSLVFV